MESVCFVFVSIFEPISLVMRFGVAKYLLKTPNTEVSLRAGHWADWPALRQFCCLVRPSSRKFRSISAPPDENKLPPWWKYKWNYCWHGRLLWVNPYQTIKTEFLFICLFSMQTQAWVSNPLYSILLPPRGTMGCYARGVSWSVEHGHWILMSVTTGKAITA